jgi:hypothetical protein
MGNRLNHNKSRPTDGKNTFKKVLNCPEPDTLHNLDNDHVIELNIDTGEIKVEEVRAVIRKLQNGKVPGTNGIQADLFKYGGDELDIQLTKLCNLIWSTGVVPQD